MDIVVAVKDVIRSIAEGDYEALEADGTAGRLSAEDLRRAIANYGRTLNIPPDKVLEQELVRDAVPIRGETDRWALVADLWTVEEGRSDLSLEATAEATPGGIRVSIEDLHVM
jgi:hypothetical protein